MGIWICFLISLFKQRMIHADLSSEKWLVTGVTAAVLAFLTGGIFEVNFYDSEVVMLVYFLMALPFTALGRKGRVVIDGKTVLERGRFVHPSLDALERGR